MRLTEAQERRITELRNLAPVAPLRRGLRLENAASADAAPKLYLYDAIGGYDGVRAKDVVAALASYGGKPIDVHLNSPGGDIFEGHAIHNALRRHSGTVTGYVDGIAASAASYVAMACDALYIEPNAQIMIHDGQGLAMGDAATMRETADLLDLLSNSIAEMYAERAGGTAEEWRERMRAETWYNATQAVEAKLVTGVAGAAVKATNDLALAAAVADAMRGGQATLTPVPDQVAMDETDAEATAPEWFGALTSGLKGLFE